MSQYINKSALIAEINKMVNEYPCDNSEQNIGYHCALYDIQNFLDTLDVKEVDLEKLKRDWRNKGYIEGRKQALIPAEQLGLSRSLDLINMDEIKIEAKKWADNNASNCDYIGVVAAEQAFIACAQWLVNKAKENKL